MNEKTKLIIKNLNYTVSANFIVLLIYAILYLIIPKFLDLENYGLWQLYVLYSGYVGFFHFGWLDGIYLKLAGKEYDDVNKKELGTQFWYFLLFQSLIVLFLICLISIFIKNENFILILVLTAISLIIVNCKQFVLFILQSTNRIKEYATLSRTDRYLYIVILFIYLLNFDSFLGVIVLDIISKFIMMLWGLYVIQDILFSPREPFKKIFPVIISNIRVGSNLMFSNIASLLITGITRIFVEKVWDIKTFGQLSLILSISNMFLTFINAIGVVMFPMLRKMRRSQLPSVYLNLRNIFVPISYLALIVYPAVKIILKFWLPQYAESLIYMGILFPIIIFEGRMSLLIMTYLKTIRKERIILISNLIGLLMAIILTSISTFILKSLPVTVLSLLICIMSRCIFSEIQLTRILKINITIDIIVEVSLVSVFIISNYYFSTFIAFFLYLIFLTIYIVYKKGNIVKALQFSRRMMKY
ncbi:lipopolysaccharide biosynthesis protein [Enterococcus dispar]|uniref:Polysaccharide biosynthesis protein C-terminal domain-containing protein n=1 Tax=Enterococcus dispar ATCC 51266 TaxID=1139219 RepID=S0KQG6_9ENTE|nr:oligosaccharide flippase family protein [Enterococcus dispar]EOT41446.1 hypothetical protein OMK_01622 [Enterococcus dispar ATCC 51266]EOW86920.1 hypothetical protein I569_02284 [Enterococcus dispar ATCC 51266]OJG39867.1 hypothetical protein RV01_GL001049 [Enterococcus dispar]